MDEVKYIYNRISRILGCKMWFISLCLLLIISFQPSAQAQDTRKIAERAFQSTVLLIMEDSTDEQSIGSGFFVRRGQVVTNFHVINDAVEGKAKLVGGEKTYEVEGVTAIRPEQDLALLDVPIPEATVLPLADSNSVQVGEPVYAVGNPKGLEGTFSEGIVSSIRKGKFGTVLQITAPISAGSSGGPVLNEKGDVVGVSFASLREGQNLNFALPSFYVKTLMSESGPVRSLASTFVSASRSKSSKVSEEPILGALPGEWTGSYVCGQGRTGLTLTLKRVDRKDPKSVSVEGTFKFYPVPENPGVPAGSYQVKGYVQDNGLVFLTGSNWIQRPDRYRMVEVLGVISEDGQTIEGKICDHNFAVSKK